MAHDASSSLIVMPHRCWEHEWCRRNPCYWRIRTAAFRDEHRLVCATVPISGLFKNRVLEEEKTIRSEFEAGEGLGLCPELRDDVEWGVGQVLPQVGLQLLVDLLLVGRVGRRGSSREQVVDVWVGVLDETRVGAKPGEEGVVGVEV